MAALATIDGGEGTSNDHGMHGQDGARAQPGDFCAICFDATVEAQCLPCKHAQFCLQCATRVMREQHRCPLCRKEISCVKNLDGTVVVHAPPPSVLETWQTRLNRAEARQLVRAWERHNVSNNDSAADGPCSTCRSDGAYLSSCEKTWITVLMCVFWAMIFLIGRQEWSYGISPSCARSCLRCATSRGRGGCIECREGSINSGLACYPGVDELPAVKTSGRIHGDVYIGLVATVQILGLLFKGLFTLRVRSRRLTTEAEHTALMFLLSIQILRFALMQPFFSEHLGSRTFRWFNTTIGTDNRTGFIVAAVDKAGAIQDPTWVSEYCTHWQPGSLVVDFPRNSGYFGGGHNRYVTIGWILGGEFSVSCLFAATACELADLLFIAPSTRLVPRLHIGSRMLAIVLSIFHFGPLLPATLFSYADGCLKYRDPQHLDLSAARWLLVVLSYTCALSAIMIGFAAFIGSLFHGVVYFLSSTLHDRVAQPLRRSCAFLLRTHACFTTGFCGACVKIYLIYLCVAAVPVVLVGVYLTGLALRAQFQRTRSIDILSTGILLMDWIWKCSIIALTSELPTHISGACRRLQPRIVPRVQQDAPAEVELNLSHTTESLNEVPPSASTTSDTLVL